MVIQLLVGLAVAAIAVLAAIILKRRTPDGPPRDAFPVPRQLNRNDFDNPSAPWLVAYFSSATCAACKDLGPKVMAMASEKVAVSEIDYEHQRNIHDRYGIAGLPMVLIVDADGVVGRAFVGSTTATELWAALAECRDPGSTPDPDLGVIL